MASSEAKSHSVRREIETRNYIENEDNNLLQSEMSMISKLRVTPGVAH